MIRELSVEKLCRKCDPQKFDYESSQDLSTLETIIGQERAVRALHFGLGIQEKGFNIYVAGMPGTGRTTAVKSFLEELALKRPVPSDWCYVNNFHDNYHPKALRLPAGRAVGFQADMESLMKSAVQEIRSTFESESYAAHQQETVKAFQQQQQTILNALEGQARQEGFFLQPSPMGMLTIPLRKGKPLSNEEFMALSPEEKQDIESKQQKLQANLDTSLRQVKGVEKNAREALQKLDKEIALYAIKHPIEDLQEKYHDLPDILEYLDRVKDDIVENLSDFKAEPEQQETSTSPVSGGRGPNLLKKYKVNVLIDNSDLKGAPVVLELNPTYSNLFGRIEQEARFGALITDFTLIRKGSLHRANGGYLVLPVEDVLRNPLSWDSLKRALENRQIVIEEMEEKIGLISTKSLRPEPFPLDVKVILIGRPDIYQLLLAYDEKFDELFKVKADFDTQMPWTEENLRDYAAFISTVCEIENLKHLDRSAMARLIEHGSRLADDQEKLSTHFGQIADVIREASYYANQENVPYVTEAHIRKAIEERYYRSNLVQEHIREMTTRGVLKIDVTGEQIGQVNGLSVMGLGDVAFGQPSRITVSVGLGKEGLIDIEREAELGGPIHSKGVMILSGYLADKFAQDKPLSLSARLVFEQSYSGVEGDSASSTELYAILSALSGLPIKQSIAVTGSVNQKGEIQAIGGVNEKIEGFFEICRLKGLDGQQGVIIPESNVANLVLKEPVVEAVKDGKFHIWAVKTIDEGIEILTGVAAGKRQEDGAFEEGTVFDRIDERLRKMAETMAEFGAPEKPETHGSG
jgi:lon-related putative ATP-dependent protease